MCLVLGRDAHSLLDRLDGALRHGDSAHSRRDLGRSRGEEDIACDDGGEEPQCAEEHEAGLETQKAAFLPDGDDLGECR